MTDVPSDACNCSALRQAARRVTRFYDEALAPVGIGINQFAILSRLDRLGPQTVRELAASLVMDRTTLSHLLKPLAARGLIAVAATTEDRRRKRVALSAEGAALLARGRPLWAGAQRRYEASVGASAAAPRRPARAPGAAARFEGPTR